MSIAYYLDIRDRPFFICPCKHLQFVLVLWWHFQQDLELDRAQSGDGGLLHFEPVDFQQDSSQVALNQELIGSFLPLVLTTYLSIYPSIHLSKC